MRQNPISCNYSISPELRPHGHRMTNNTFDVAAGGICAWTAVSASDWITITAGGSGTGNGTVSYAVEANPTYLERTGMVMVASEVFTVSQKGQPCSYSITPGTRMHGFGFTSNIVSLTTGVGCTWTAVPSNNWITITPSGTGSGDLIYNLRPNPYTTPRTGMVWIADELLTLIQDPSPGGPCVYEVSPRLRSHGYGAASNYTKVSVPAGCTWTVVNTNSWISVVPGYLGIATDDVGYLVEPNPSTIPRSGNLTVAGHTYTVNQEGALCTAMIVPKTRSHGWTAPAIMCACRCRSNVPGPWTTRTLG